MNALGNKWPLKRTD